MRRRFKHKHKISLEERLIAKAHQARELPAQLPKGNEQNVLLEKARQDETVANLTRWINSPGLQPPK